MRNVKTYLGLNDVAAAEPGDLRLEVGLSVTVEVTGFTFF